MKHLAFILGILATSTDAFSIQLHQHNVNVRRSQVKLQASSSNGVAPYVDDPSLIRNIALIGHSHAGKTSLAEWMLYDDKVITQKPSVGKSSLLDSDPIEASRHSSLFSHFMRIPHRSSPQYLLQVADTPFGDFPSDAFAALDGADSAVLVVSAADGVQSGTVNAFQHCSKAGIKTILALSKMDRPFLNIQEVLEDIEMSLDDDDIKPIPIQVHQGVGENFEGIKSLFEFDNQGLVKRNVDPDLNEAWVVLEEAVAMTNDDLLIEYLEEGSLADDKVLSGLRSAVMEHKILPVVYTSAIQDKGVSELMDAIVAIMPNPIEARESTLRVACEGTGSADKCGMEPGVEAGFAARVLHTIIDSFGSLSIVRVISNDRNNDDNSRFASLPHDVVSLRTGSQVKMPSVSTCFGLCGKQRQPLVDGVQILPGDVIALPKVDLETNDVICTPSAVKEEEIEIEIEELTEVLSPLSRPVQEVPLMASATISLSSAQGSSSGRGNKKKNKSAGNDDKLINALTTLSREDLAMKVEQDSGQWVVKCMSKDHLMLIVERLRDRYHVEVELGDTPVAYRESISRVVKKVEGRHKKQSGGSGQFGLCYITVEPLEEGAGIEFESRIKGGAINKTFINSVEKGVREQLAVGGPLGFPVTDVKVILTDGKMHSVDSKDIAFQSAGKIAIRQALKKAGTKLLQPMEKVTFLIDEQLQGEINGIVSRADGYVTLSNLAENHIAEVEAIIPSACISDVSETLRAESAGEGQYSSVFSHYQTVPESQVQSICDDLKA